MGRENNEVKSNKSARDKTVKSEDSIQETGNKSIEELLTASSKIVCNICMEIRRHESVLIIADSSTIEIGQSLHSVASKISHRVLLVVMPMTKHHGEEPPETVAEIMRHQNVIIAPTRFSITHTKACFLACKEGARVATMPNINLEMYTKGAITADFTEIKKDITRISDKLKRRRIVNVSAINGTDVSFEIDHKKWIKEDSGICNRPGMVTNLPAGKIFVMPKEGTMNGTIVIDGSFDSALISEPLTMKVEDGFVVELEGGEQADAIRKTFESAASKLKSKDMKNVWNVAQFGFGINPKAKIVGNVLEDEKALGSCYFAIGDNTSIGGNIKSGILISGVIKLPNVSVDTLKLMKEGNLLI
tara:strand:+ start:293 stop:1372 length:1080 start_codon:yes stop_codon:yes gene_type:complete